MNHNIFNNLQSDNMFFLHYTSGKINLQSDIFKKKYQIDWFYVSSDKRLNEKFIIKFCRKIYFNQFFANVNIILKNNNFYRERLFRRLYSRIGDKLFNSGINDIRYIKEDLDEDLPQTTKLDNFIINNKLSRFFINDYFLILLKYFGNNLIVYQEIPESTIIKYVEKFNYSILKTILIYQNISRENRIKYFSKII